MTDVHFIWNDEPYHFDSGKKYVIFFRGCFCPPGRGHFSLLDKYIHQPNVTFVISQMAKEKRHGVPAELSQKIWRLYIDRLVPADARHRVVLTPSGNRHKLRPYLDARTTLVYLRGNEKDMGRKTHTHYERHIVKKHAHFLRMLRELGVPCDYIFLDRPEVDKLSATKFVQAIKAGAPTKALAYFMPRNLPKEDMKYIVRKLRACDLR